MRFALILLLAFLTGAGPALAQLHERGVARSGSVLRSQTGGMAFTCRAACSVEAGCTGWSFLRAGESGPQARCDLLTGAVQARPDACCDSGELQGPPRPSAASGPPVGENRYADRSQRPTGPPVTLTADLWSGEDDEPEEAEEGQAAGDSEPAATNVQQTPAQQSPASRMLANEPARLDGQPHYSVQREYAPAPPTPLHPAQPGGPQAPGMQAPAPAVPAAPSPMANPQRW